MRELRQLPGMRAVRRLARGAGGVALLALGFAAAWVAFPFPRAQLERFPAATVLLDGEGRPLRVQLGPHDEDCRLRYEAKPDDWIGKAIVASEDRRFWSHPGVDVLALARAAGQNLTHGRTISGASTLSTQVIRLLWPRRRTLLAKIVEAFRALQLERICDKRAVLEQYLNRAPFGSNLVGIESASRRYFAKSPHDLSLAEAALLAGLPQSPSRLRPDRHPARAKERQAYVLGRMAACGLISEAQRAEARAQPIALRRDAYPFRAPHFCELALGELADTAAPPVVRTTLDSALQRRVEDTLRRHAVALRRSEVYGGAVVLIDVKTGAVRALAGSPDYGDAAHGGQVNGAVASRSAGSTLKPFAYAMAMDQGRLTPQQVLADVPRRFKDYTPENFAGEFMGPVAARDALVLSLNIPAISVVEQLGVPAFHANLRRLGLGTLNKPSSHYGLGLALGNGEVRLLDLANAYACLARGGEWLPYRLTLAGAVARPRRFYSGEACWLIADMLGGDERSRDTTGHAADVPLPRLAWKTGTSSGFRDAWAVAFNPDWVIGVWIGNPDGRPADQLVGARAAVPIVWDIFRELYPDNDSPWFARPAGLKKRPVCALSGAPPGPHCPQVADDWFIEGVSRFEPCNVHRLVAVRDEGRGTRGDAEPAVRLEVREVWPPEIAAFLRTREAPGAAAKEPGVAVAGKGPRILTPAAGSAYRKLDDWQSDAQRVQFVADNRGGGGRLYWFVDDLPLGSVSPAQPLLWALERGRHTVICCDERGRTDRVQITVE